MADQGLGFVIAGINGLGHDGVKIQDAQPAAEIAVPFQEGRQTPGAAVSRREGAGLRAVAYFMSHLPGAAAAAGILS